MRNKIDCGTIKGSGSYRMCMGGIGGMSWGSRSSMFVCWCIECNSIARYRVGIIAGV
jgi:hypothetical protein